MANQKQIDDFVRFVFNRFGVAPDAIPPNVMDFLQQGRFQEAADAFKASLLPRVGGAVDSPSYELSTRTSNRRPDQYPDNIPSGTPPEPLGDSIRTILRDRLDADQARRQMTRELAGTAFVTGALGKAAYDMSGTGAPAAPPPPPPDPEQENLRYLRKQFESRTRRR